MKRFLTSLSLVPVVAVVLASPALAAPKFGCPTAFNEMTVAQAAAYMWPRLLAPEGFPGGESEFRGVLQAVYDKNGDGSICLKVTTFDNSNSHWFKVGMQVLGSPTEFMNPIDNNANASNL